MSASAEERRDVSPLLEREAAWRERYCALESHGYRLRQRYKPDWRPSWVGSKKSVYRYEDYASHNSSITMDAVRISDGRRVFLKRVLSSSSELAIHRFLSDSQRLQDPNNHTAALLDEFSDDDDPQYTFMVLPLLRRYYYPEFYSVDEVVDFIKQLLEGLVYMHKLNIAHRDCSVLNVMMDADPLYPKGFHPVQTIADSSGVRLAHAKRRRDVGGVRYYYIDFGISSKFSPGEPKQVVGVDGQDKEVPELSRTEPYSPFHADVFILGNLFKKSLLKKYENLTFLEPLVEEMTDNNWMNRCTATEALEIFNHIISEQSWYALRWRLKQKDVGALVHFFQDVGTITRESVSFVRSVFATKSQETIHLLRDRLSLKKSE